MNLFAIGDTHLSFGKDKPMDIFKGWDNYVERLEKQWNAVVTDEDTVVINGDISWAMKLSECYEDFKFINELNGKKIILKGNHDYWWTTLNKMNNYLRENDFSTISILFNNSYSLYAVQYVCICTSCIGCGRKCRGKSGDFGRNFRKHPDSRYKCFYR